MKTTTVRDLRNRFGEISKWLEAGETVRILKRGKPFARVVPDSRHPGLLGCMKGTGRIPDDIDDPVPVEWEAAR